MDFEVEKEESKSAKSEIVTISVSGRSGAPILHPGDGSPSWFTPFKKYYQTIRSRGKPGFRARLAVIGPGGGGKTTFVKQLVSAFSKGFSKEEKHDFAESIQQTLGRSLLYLGNALEGERVPMSEASVKFLADIRTHFDRLDTWILDNKDFQERALLFWNSKEVQDLWPRKEELALPDELEYYMTRIDTVLATAYEPSSSDIARLRIPSSGHMRYLLKLEKDVFEMIDIGGNPSERRKWKGAFEYEAMIFFVGLADYNLLNPYNSKNMLLEALEDWENFVNVFELSEKPVYLVFNKNQDFLEKIKKIPLTDVFPEFGGGSDPIEAKDYVKTRFMSKVKAGKERITVIFMTAIDAEDCQHTFLEIRDDVKSRFARRRVSH